MYKPEGDAENDAFPFFFVTQSQGALALSVQQLFNI